MKSIKYITAFTFLILFLFMGNKASLAGSLWWSCCEEKAAKKASAEKKKENDKDNKQQISAKKGELTVYATSEEQLDKNTRIAVGYVDIRYQGQRLQADKVTYNTESYFFRAEGNVVFQQKEMTIAGERMEANLHDKTGSFYDAILYTEPEFMITAGIIERLGENKYKIHQGKFTACSQPNPRWFITASEATVKVDNYISLKNPALKVKGVPVFYLPYLYWPLKKDRSTGFLLPSIGSSSLKGLIISNAFFWAIRRNMDASIYYDYHSRLGIGRGGEYRYILGKYSSGNFYGYYLKDRIRESKRYKLKFNHAQYFKGGFRAVVNVDYLSDFQYRRDIEEQIYMNTSRSIGSRAYLSWSRSYYSFNIITSRNKTYFSADSSVTLQSLPQIDFRARDQKLGGSPFYFSFISSFNIPARITEKTNWSSDLRLYRADLFPRISMPIKGLRWLTINPSFAFRDTYYNKRMHPKQNILVDEKLNRTYYEMGVSVLGPVFNKIFGGQDKKIATRYKHIIEPRVSIVYITEPKNQEYVWRYDSIDTVAEVKELRYSLTNRLLSKRVGVSDKQASAREFLTIEFSQNFSLDPNLRTSYGRQFNRFTGEYMDKPIISRFSPILLKARFNPSKSYYIDSALEYDMEDNTLNSFGISAEVDIPDRTNINFGWRKTYAYLFGRIPVNVISSNGAVYVAKRRLRLDYDLNYDFINNAMRYSSFGVQYQAQCISLLFNYRRFNIYTRQESQFRFFITLANLGSTPSHY